MKEEITSLKKNYLESKKNVTAKDKWPLLLFCFPDFEQAFVRGFVYFLFPWLTLINLD